MRIKWFPLDHARRNENMNFRRELSSSAKLYWNYSPMHLVNSIEPKGIHEQERKLDRIMNIIKSVIRYLSKYLK